MNELTTAALCRELLRDLDRLAEKTIDRVRAEVPAFRVGVSRQEHRESARHCLAAALAHIGGWSQGSAQAPIAMTTLRIAQGFALADLLRALRLGATVVWGELAGLAGTNPASQTVLSAATRRCWELLDVYSRTVEQAYSESARMAANRRDGNRAYLLDTVISGDPALSAFWDAVSALDLPRSARFVIAQLTVATDPERAIRTLRAVESAWFQPGATGWTGLIALRAAVDPEDLTAVLAKLAATAGLSSEFTTISHTPQARSEARVAAAAAGSSRPLVRYDLDRVAVMVASTPEAAAVSMRATLGPVLALPPERADPIIETVRQWIASNHSTAVTAAMMQCHRNTVTYRLRRFQELSGHLFSDNAWLAQVILALEAHAQAIV